MSRETGRERPGSGRERQREQPGQDRGQAAAADHPGRGRDRDHDQDTARPAGRGRPGSGRERERERPGQDRDHAAAWADRARPGPDLDYDQDRDRDAAAQADRDQAAAEREPAARGHDQEAAASGGQAFRLPSADERAARARDEAARRDRTDSPAAGDDFWDRVSEELSGSGDQAPVRPAWPSTAGPRAMGAGSAARYGPAGTGDDEPEAAWSPPGRRQVEPASWSGETSRSAGRPDEDDEQAKQPEAGESSWDRMVPPYVDDLTRPRRDREPAGSGPGDLPAREDSPAGEEAEAAAGPEAGGVWSAWSSFGATRAEEEAASGGYGPRGATAGDVDSGRAASGDEAREDEVAAAAPAVDERDGSAAEPAALGATPGAALAGVAAGADRTDEAAERHTEADEPEPATAEAGSAEPGTAEAGHPGHAAEPGEPGGADAAMSEDGAIAGVTEAPGSAGEDAVQEDGAEQGTAEADDGAAADGNGRAAVASGGGGSDNSDAGEHADGGADGGATPMDDEVTIVPGVARYHRRGCILIRFLSDGDLETTTRREAEAIQLVPCKACQPDEPDPSA